MARSSSSSTVKLEFAYRILFLLSNCAAQGKFNLYYLTLCTEIRTYLLGLGLSLLCSEKLLLCFLALLQFCPYYARF